MSFSFFKWTEDAHGHPLKFFVQVSLPFDKLGGFWTWEQFFGCTQGRRFLHIQPFDDIFLEFEPQPQTERAEGQKKGTEHKL